MSDSRSPRTKAPRLGFVDDARGVAVVLMILWHTVDGWIRPSLKSGVGFDTLRMLGGTAAPMFLALAGAGAAMKGASDRARGIETHVRLRSQVARGFHVMAAGYTMRAFMWLVDGGTILRVNLAVGYVPIVLGLGFTLRGLELVGPGRRRGPLYTALGVGLYGAGVLAIHRIAPGELSHVLRVDVLQAIGFSLVGIALFDAAFDIGRRPWSALLLGVLVGLATETVERAMPGALPAPLAAVVSKWATPLGQDLSRFPLFPWLGYGLVGAAIGATWHRAASNDRAVETMLAMAAGCALVASLASTPFAYDVMALHPMTQKPIFMLHKIGLGIALSGLVSVVCELGGRFPLRELGCTSMLVYWVHLELVYGLSGKPLVRSLGYGAWVIAFTVLTLVMAYVARVRSRPPPFLDGLGRRILGE